MVELAASCLSASYGYSSFMESVVELECQVKDRQRKGRRAGQAEVMIIKIVPVLSVPHNVIPPVVGLWISSL